MGLDYLKQVLSNLGAQATDPRVGGGPNGFAGAAARRQSAKELLQERIFQDRQHEKDFQQNQTRLNSQNAAAIQEHQSNIDLNKSKEADANKQRDFNQFAETSKLFSGGHVQVAERGPDEDTRVVRQQSMDTIPGPEQNLMEPGEVPTQTTMVRTPGGLQTKGRPTFDIGGQTLIPTSPEEGADTQLKIASKQQQAAGDAFQQKMASFKDAHPDWAKDHDDELSQVELHNTFGWVPPEKAHGKVMDSLFEKALGGDKDALDLYKKGQELSEKPSDRTGLSKGAINAAARSYRMTGKMPTSFSMRGRPDIEAVLNRADEMDPEGQFNAGAQGAFFDANKKSMAAQLGAYDKLTGFEKTAKKNMDNAMALMKSKIPVTNSQLLNQPIQTIAEKVFSGSDAGQYLPAFHAAQNVANNEYARITALAGQPGVLSEEARQEIMKYNPKTITFNQLQHVMEVYNADAENRQRSAAEQLSIINNRFGSGSNENLRNILLEDPEVRKTFPDLANVKNIATEGGGGAATIPGVTPIKSGGGGGVGGAKVHLRAPNGGGEILLDPVADKDRIERYKSGGAVEVK